MGYNSYMNREKPAPRGYPQGNTGSGSHEAAIRPQGLEVAAGGGGTAEKQYTRYTAPRGRYWISRSTPASSTWSFTGWHGEGLVPRAHTRPSSQALRRFSGNFSMAYRSIVRGMAR